MRSINITNAYELLASSSAILLEGRALVPELANLEYEPENEFLKLRWHELGLDFEVTFTEGDNEEVQVEGSVLTLTNNEGDSEELTLLTEVDAEGLLEY
jgi:hypothetical protein